MFTAADTPTSWRTPAARSWLALGAAAVAACVIAGCPVDVNPTGDDQVRWLCVADSDCGDGWFCTVNNVCVSPGSVEGALGDILGGADASIAEDDASSGASTHDPAEDEALFLDTDDETGFVRILGVKHPVYSIVEYESGDGDWIVELVNDCATPDRLQVFFDAPRKGGQPTGKVRVVSPGGTFEQKTALFNKTTVGDNTFFQGSGTATRLEAGGLLEVNWEARISAKASASATIHLRAHSPITIADNEAVVQGLISPDSKAKFLHLIEEHHDTIDTLIFHCWHGWQADLLTHSVGTKIHDYGFDTKVVRGSMVRAGLLFAAGNRRIREQNAQFIGADVDASSGIRFIVRTWTDGDGDPASLFACPSSSLHAGHLAYLTAMMGQTNAEEFYCSSVSHNDDYYLSTAEAVGFSLVTDQEP